MSSRLGTTTGLNKSKPEVFGRKTHKNYFSMAEIYFSFLPEMLTAAPGSMTPLFGRTQYLRGAVVFTLKHTRLSDGFFSLRLAVTTSVNGPDAHRTTHTHTGSSSVFNATHTQQKQSAHTLNCKTCITFYKVNWKQIIHFISRS